MSERLNDRDRQIVRLARLGVSRQDIALQLDISPWLVHHALRHAGMTRMRERAPYSTEGDRYILSLYRQGLRTREIAKRVQCDLEHIRYVARHAGILERGRTPLRIVTPDMQRAMVDDYVGGLSSIAIGKKYGISDVLARRYLKRSGVTMRRSWMKHRGPRHMIKRSSE